jgi:hypothetical protein
MRRSLPALGLVVVLLLIATTPASATSWFQLRLNPSTGDWKDTTGTAFTDLPYSFTTTMFGATGFWQIPGWRIGLRGNIDTGSLSSFSAGGPGAPGYNTGSWRYYDLSLGLPINVGQGRALLFAGYSNTNWRAEFPTGFSRQAASGIAFGLDLWYPLGEKWYLAGSATFGPSQDYKYYNGPPEFVRFAGKASVDVFQVGVGWRFAQMSSLELGWRGGGFSVSQTASLIDGMSTRWSGFYLGLNFMRP